MPTSPSPATSPATSPLKLPEPDSYIAPRNDTSTQQHQQAQLPFRKISFAAAPAQDGRRPSVQLEARKSEATLRTGSPKPKIQRRMSSPPPPM